MRNVVTKDITGILALIIIMIVAGLMLSSQSGNGDHSVGVEASPDPSVFNDRASGSRALFEWMGKLGRRTEVDRSDWENIPQDAAMLVSVAPRINTSKIVPIISGEDSSQNKSALSSADADGLIKWLKSGHTLLLMTSSLPGPASPSPSAANAQFGAALSVDVSSSVALTPSSYLAPLAPLALTSGINMIRIHPGARVLSYSHDAVTLFGTPPSLSGRGPKQGEPFAILLPIGRGRAIIIADSEFAGNSNMARADNAAFLSNIIEAYTHPGDRVLFDEYHHGDIAGTGADVWAAMGHPIQYAIIQGGLALIILLIVLGARFGAPKPIGGRIRRSSSEYVTSLAGLYRNAHATVPALDIIYRQFLRDLCGRLALPPDVSLDQLAEAASRRAHLNKANLQRLLGNCERALDQQSLTESELLLLVKYMERFRKELGID